jgi:hypothetical protein
LKFLIEQEESMNEVKKRGRWQAGESGNPKGRTSGSGETGKLRSAIAKHLPDIIEQLACRARTGDPQAARLLLERVLPPVKAIEQAQAIALPEGTLTEQGRAVIAAMAAGELSSGQGAQLLAALGTLGKIAELDELAARIATLEERHGKS